MARDPSRNLTDPERKRLAEGFHTEVAAGLRERGEHHAAGWVAEQIWDWAAALRDYQTAGVMLEALRVALESGEVAGIDAVLDAIAAEHDAETLEASIAVLETRRRPMEAARLLALRNDPAKQARALVRAGDRLGGAHVLAAAGQSRQALEILRGDAALRGPEALGLASSLAWDLGDAEGAARFAQRALAAGSEDEPVRALLARALGTLGHDLAAQVVLGDRDISAGAAMPGRYRITGLASGGLVGATYVGIDRATLQEVEVHLLLDEQADGGFVPTEVTAAIDAFCAAARVASELGHPAIRPILRVDPEAGLLVTPRAEGPDLRSLIRAPGMWKMVPRARALVAFLLEGLNAAHHRGLIHGRPLPSRIVCDALGRPMLGPFGAHHLAGLTATHTGGLEEIVATVAPELQGGAPPSQQSDVFALGAILLALLSGSLGRELQEPECALVRGAPGFAELELGRQMTAHDPAERPTVAAALALLRTPIADVRELVPERDHANAADRSTAEGHMGAIDAGLVVTAHESWSDDALNRLCNQTTPWYQPILDREGRAFVLAPWPSDCKTLGDDTSRWRSFLRDEAIALDDPALENEVRRRLRPSSIVRTPAGEWMLALDDLLTR